LTDFLASNNISAAQIRDDYDRRVADGARQATQEEQDADLDMEEPEYEPTPEPESPEDKAKKRKRQQAIEKIKKSKEFARRKARRTGEPDDDDDALVNEMMHEKQRPTPGQLDNCEICGKRFTVTPYSKTGPSGGLLCADCSKNHTGKDKKAPPKKRSSGIGRRQNQSALLDGLASVGAQSLLETCIKKVAENISDVEEFGDLPPPVMHRLSQILARRRAITSTTLDLFLRPQNKEINIYDCAKLGTDDYHKILATMPNLTRLNLRFVTPMKDRIFQYMMDRDMNIQDLHLDSPNLVTDEVWRQLFTRLGPRLRSLKLWNLDSAFDDETVEVMSQNCTQLQRLKLKHLNKIGDKALEAISTMKSLQHLSLHISQETTPEPLLQILTELGPNLRSLSLEEFYYADDRLLELIREKCRHLTKLRLAINAELTDKAFANLFRGWSNPPLTFADFHRVRDVDMANPGGPPEPVGLASDGFVALMEHSGAKLQSLNVASCRHISYAAYEEAFGEHKRYPELKYLDIAFNSVVDDYLAQCIFRCCPALTRLVVFGCFKIRDIKIPRGVAVIGTVGAKLTVNGITQKELV
jgi:DNA repair protein RAD7